MCSLDGLFGGIRSWILSTVGFTNFRAVYSSDISFFSLYGLKEVEAVEVLR